MERIDLHTHSKASDGTLSPTELVVRARDLGLKALGLTDHDTVEGLDEALGAGKSLGFQVVPGVEISVRVPTSGSMHLLGYFIDHQNSALLDRLLRLQQSRKDRNPQIIEKLNRLGLQITLREVEDVSGGGQTGRPHIASVLQAKGYVSGIQDAFDRYLKKGAPAHVPKYRFEPEIAFRMIHEAGGVSSLAHPYTLAEDFGELERWIKKFKELGLGGIEVYYSEHSPGQTRFYKDLARRYGLAQTGGSDFHGANKPEIELGIGKGGLEIPYELLRDLEALKMKGLSHVSDSEKEPT